MRFFGHVHPVPLIAGIVVAVIAVQLGNWQLRRADEKREIGASIAQFERGVPVAVSDAGEMPPAWSRVSLCGEWIPDRTLYHDNRVHERQPGYHVLMPLRLDSGAVVLVNRGWIAAGPDRAVLPQVLIAAGPVELVGRVVVPEKDPFSLGDSPRDGARWQYIDTTAYSEWAGFPVAAWVVQQTSASADGLLRAWPAPDLGVDKHRGYAVQWYSLATLAAALTAFYLFRSFRKHAA